MDHLCALSHDPIVDGALVTSNSSTAAPARSTATSSTLSPPASTDPITVSAFVPLFRTMPNQTKPRIDQLSQTQPLGQHRRQQQTGARQQIPLIE